VSRVSRKRETRRSNGGAAARQIGDAACSLFDYAFPAAHFHCWLGAQNVERKSFCFDALSGACRGNGAISYDRARIRPVAVAGANLRHPVFLQARPSSSLRLGDARRTGDARLSATCVDARFGARKIFWIAMARSRVLTCVRPHECSGSHAGGPYGSSRIGSKSEPRAFKHSVANWFSRSHLTDYCAISD